MSTEMIDRVARAIEGVELGNNWEAMAKAAIEALRDPTDAMLGHRSVVLSEKDAWEMWHDMIDEALR